MSEWRYPVNIKRCAHNWTTNTESVIWLLQKLQILGRKKLWGIQTLALKVFIHFWQFFTFLYFAINCLSLLKSICLYVTSIKVIFHVILKNTTEKARIMRYTRWKASNTFFYTNYGSILFVLFTLRLECVARDLLSTRSNIKDCV